MATTTRKPLIEAAEIPADRRFRLDDERLNSAIAEGMLPPGHRAEDRLSLDQYHRMDWDGLLTKRDRVELLGGWLVTRESIKPPHRIATRKVRIAIDRILPQGWYCDEQKPVSLPLADSEPEPDVQVTRGASEDYSARHPGPEDLALVVAFASLHENRGYKKRLYASEGVLIYWIVNLIDRCLEVYSEPSGPSDAPDYRTRQILGPEQRISLILDGREVGLILVSDLLP